MRSCKLRLSIQSSQAPYPTELGLSPLRRRISIGFGSNSLQDAYLEVESEDLLIGLELSKRAPLDSRRSVASHNTLFPGINSSLCPVSKLQFTQDVADMSLYRLLANHQLSSDIAVTQSLSN